MLSEIALKRISQSIKKLTAVRLWPYHWDSTTQQLSSELSAMEFTQFILCISLETCFMVPYFAIVPGILSDNSDRISKIVVPSMIMICCVTLLCTQSLYWIFGWQFLTFINKFFQLENRMSEFSKLHFSLMI